MLNKTSALNGIYVNEVGDELMLNNGSFEFVKSVRGSYTTSSTALTLKMTHIYDDGKWHTIDAVYLRSATYSVNGNKLTLIFEDDKIPLVFTKK